MIFSQFSKIMLLAFVTVSVMSSNAMGHKAFANADFTKISLRRIPGMIPAVAADQKSEVSNSMLDRIAAELPEQAEEIIKNVENNAAHAEPVPQETVTKLQKTQEWLKTQKQSLKGNCEKFVAFVTNKGQVINNNKIEYLGMAIEATGVAFIVGRLVDGTYALLKVDQTNKDSWANTLKPWIKNGLRLVTFAGDITAQSYGKGLVTLTNCPKPLLYLFAFVLTGDAIGFQKIWNACKNVAVNHKTDAAVIAGTSALWGSAIAYNQYGIGKETVATAQNKLALAFTYASTTAKNGWSKVSTTAQNIFATAKTVMPSMQTCKAFAQNTATAGIGLIKAHPYATAGIAAATALGTAGCYYGYKKLSAKTALITDDKEMDLAQEQYDIVTETVVVDEQPEAQQKVEKQPVAKTIVNNVPVVQIEQTQETPVTETQYSTIAQEMQANNGDSNVEKQDEQKHQQAIDPLVEGLLAAIATKDLDVIEDAINAFPDSDKQLMLFYLIPLKECNSVFNKNAFAFAIKMIAKKHGVKISVNDINIGL